MLWVIRVTQLVDELLDGDDEVDLPAGSGGKGSFKDYEIEADNEELALDEFHATIPIGCLEDFQVDAFDESQLQDQDPADTGQPRDLA